MKHFIKILIALAAMTAPNTAIWALTKSITYLNYVGGDAVFEEATADATQITSETDGLSGWYNDVEGNATIGTNLSSDNFAIDKSKAFPGDLTNSATVNIQLTSSLGENVTVTFYKSDKAPTADDISTFTTPVTEADAGDWIVAHIVPGAGYWTDRKLLMAYDIGGSLTRGTGPSIDPVNTITLIQADTYEADGGEMKPRHDGAGWYYYQIPADHTVNAGYYASTINGSVVPVFSFSDDDPKATIAQDFDNNTVTVGRTTDDWTAMLTYDKFVWSFTGTIGTLPHVQSISIQKGGTELLNLTDATTIDILVNPEYTAGTPCIGYNDLKPEAGQYGWFSGRDDRYIGQTRFIIEPPFQPVDPTQVKNTWGTSANPWAITSAADLNMLSKCLTIGVWNTEKQYLRQTADIDMREVNDFLPIGVSNPGVSFKGHYDGNGKTISGVKVTYSTKPDNSLDPMPAYVGLFGLVEGTSDDPASVESVTLVNSSFSATAGSCAVAVGGIAGIAGSIQGSNPGNATISNCKFLVNGEGATSAISGLSTGCATGAIVGNFLVGTLSQNYYGYGVTVSNSSGIASGYTKRGTWMGTGGTATYAWDDITDNDGAMLYVKKASIVNGTSTNGSAVIFNEVTKGTDRYDKDGDDFYYAVGQPVTLSVTLESRTEKTDIRTFYDELNALTMNDGTTDTDIKDALGFTMPEADATVTATIAESKWFTIPSNNKNWMSFYHEWKDASGASANYIVTDGDGTGKTIEVKTVASVDPDAGTFTPADIQGGVSFCEMPTLFHYADKNDDTAVLPALLKFTPVDPNVNYTQPDKANQFKGTDTGKELAPSDKCYVLNNMGDFIFAYVVTDVDDKIPAHHCYIDLVDNPHFARLLKVAGDATGIDTILRDDSNAVGAWYSLDGRRLDRQPAKKGLYIHKGKKAVIK